MKKLIRLIFLGVVACLILGSLNFGEEQPLVEQARAEGKVVFYANITAVEPVMEAFHNTYGIETEYVRISTAKYIPTVLAEHQAGKLQADVLQAPVPVLQILKDAGVLGVYVSPMTCLYPEWARATDGVIQQFGIEYIAILYNTDLVKPEDVPTKYQDLTDPKWYEKIVMPDPTTHATTIEWLVGLKEHVFASEDEWMAFLRGLAANKPMFVASLGPTPDPIARGEKLIGISMPKYLITKAPAPLGWAKLHEQPLLGTPRGIAIAKNPPHPNAAKLFIDFWLSETTMRILANQVGEYVLYSGVYPPIPGIEEAVVLPLRSMSDAEIQHWAEVFAGIFR